MPPSLAGLLVRSHDAENKGSPGEIRHGTTKLTGALRPLLPPEEKPS